SIVVHDAIQRLGPHPGQLHARPAIGVATQLRFLAKRIEYLIGCRHDEAVTIGETSESIGSSCGAGTSIGIVKPDQNGRNAGDGRDLLPRFAGSRVHPTSPGRHNPTGGSGTGPILLSLASFLLAH